MNACNGLVYFELLQLVKFRHKAITIMKTFQINDITW